MRIFTEWLAPSVDENDPLSCDPDLDMFNPKNGPPYSAESIKRYRARQVALHANRNDTQDKEMHHLLQINSSIRGDSGESTRLANRFVESWRTLNPAHSVVVRNVGDCSIPHLDGERFGAFVTPPDRRTPAQNAVIEFSDSLIDELRAADIVVFGAPLYNFQIPSGLKAYIDHVTRAGVTFRYTETGPVGLLTGKNAVVISARGGFNSGQVSAVADYMSTVLEFLGFEAIELIGAQGLAMGPEMRSRGLAEAEQAIQSTVQRFAPAAASACVAATSGW